MKLLRFGNDLHLMIIQRRRRVAKLAHPEASACEAGRVGSDKKRAKPRGAAQRDSFFW